MSHRQVFREVHLRLLPRVARRARVPPSALRHMSPPPRPRRKRRSIVASIVATLDRVTPFWGPQLVVAGALALDFLLPERLTVGPSWLLPTVEGLLLVGLVIASPHPRLRYSALRRRVAIGLIGFVSLVNIISLGMLAHLLLHHGTQSGRPLVFSGIALWGTNVLLFGLWYYELDRGGPVPRML